MKFNVELTFQNEFKAELSRNSKLKVDLCLSFGQAQVRIPSVTIASFA